MPRYRLGGRVKVKRKLLAVQSATVMLAGVLASGAAGAVFGSFIGEGEAAGVTSTTSAGTVFVASDNSSTLAGNAAAGYAGTATASATASAELPHIAAVGTAQPVTPTSGPIVPVATTVTVAGASPLAVWSVSRFYPAGIAATSPVGTLAGGPAPFAPINFTATAASSSQINLSWAANPSGPAPTDYDLDFSTVSSAGPWTSIAIGLVTSYQHTGRPAETQHWYRLKANAGGIPQTDYAAASGTTQASGGVTFNPPYPRIATHWLGGNQPYYQASVQQALARGSIALLGIFPGWEQAYGTTLESCLQGIHSYNPNTRVYNYILNEAWNGNAIWSEVTDKVNAMKWWLYPSGTSGSPVPSFYGLPYLTYNNTLFTPDDAGGKNFVEWFVDYCITTFDRPSLAGFYLDNVFWQPRVDGDWNRDGTSDSAGNSTVWTWQRQGLARHFEYIRSILPNKDHGGNAGDWIKPEAVLTGFENMMDWGLMESIIGQGWSLEYWYPWITVLEQYRKVLGYLRGFKGAIFHQVGAATDYQAMRYGLATCLLDNGWYCFNTSAAYSDAPYFDEYGFSLGYPTQDPPASAYSQGVWLREFDNGCAIVNPKGNGAKNITLPATDTWAKFNGTQAPSINNGAAVTQVTLSDRDGLILRRT